MNIHEAYVGTLKAVSVFIPKTEIIEDKPSYFAVPLRGSSHTLAVYDREKDKIIGWVEVGNLGYQTAKDFMKSSKYHPEKLPEAYR
jgi:hypothetical protein